MNNLVRPQNTLSYFVVGVCDSILLTICFFSYFDTDHSAGKHDRGPFFRLIRSRLTGSI